jgi:hypothetical protein
MNHNDNTSGYILSNYLSNIFHLHQRRPSSDPEDARTPRDPDGVLSCVMPCRNPDPTPDPRKEYPDPTRFVPCFFVGERGRERADAINFYISHICVNTTIKTNYN